MATRVLRPYQQEAVQAVHEHWREWDRELLVMGTGTGKTYTAKCIIEDRLSNGSVLFMAHRDELIEQARDTFGDAGKIKGSVTDIKPITVGSVQTLVNRPRYEGFNTLIIDEAHHAVSDSYQKVLAQYPDAKVLGLTATPDRKGLGRVFEGIAYEYGLRRAVQEGYLSQIVARTIPIDIDLTQVKTRVGDFEVTGLVEALEPYLPEIARSMVEHAMDRKTIVFLPLVRMAQEFAEMLRSYGFDAREVDGQSQDRKETLEWFSKAGKGSVICNAMLLTEGYDCPDTDCVVVLRPTKVRSLYSQMIGRGTRLAPDKKDCLILDFLWLSTRHDLCRPASLITDNDEDAEKVSEKAVEAELELFDALTDVEEQRRNALADAIRANAKRKARLVDPLTFFVDVNEQALLDYQPEFPWERQPASEKQIKLIEGAGIDTTGMCKGQASKVIDAIFRRRDAGLATAKQMRMLEQKGFQNVGLWTFEQASAMMGRLAQNKWRVPWDVNPATYVPQ
jgi:superfamily II DNA or RNA helicase